MADPVYRDRDFRLFLGLRVVSTLAVMIQSVAVGWQVYDMERTPLALAWVGLAEFVPMFLLTLPAGAVVDHTDQRKVLSLAFCIQALSAGLLLTLSVLHLHAAWPFYGVIAVFGVARGFYGPSAQSLLAFLVPQERLPRSIALSSSTYQAAVIAGPAVGGFIYALGPVTTYGTCLAAFCIAAALTATLGGRRNQPRADGQATPVERVREGLAFVFSARWSWGRSRWTCSQCCWAGRWRCCRCLHGTSCMSDRRVLAPCAAPRRSGRPERLCCWRGTR